jgi:hypothetical protein
MKTNRTYFICAVAIPLFSTAICKAQTLALKPAPAAVVIDGNTKEWGDDLSYSDPKTKINYTISNDKDNLYLVIKTKDPVQQSSILGAGVTFSVDTKGKKKSSYVVTFPSIPSDRDQSSFINMPAAQLPAHVNYAVKYSKIAVKGFKDISDDEITTDNSTGVKTVIGFDPATSYLTYEEAIPLKLFHADDAMAGEWAFNIKLKAVQGKETNNDRSGGGSHSGSKAPKPVGSADIFATKVGDGMIDLTDAIDFWGKFTLAKAQ